MKNSDYTCDVCGAQMSYHEAYFLRLGKMSVMRTDPYPTLRYDLCESCHDRARSAVTNLLVVLREEAQNV